jgi:Initiator Replication protein
LVVLKEKRLKIKNQITKNLGTKTQPDSAFQLSVTTLEEQGILESFSRLPQAEREIVRQLLDKFGSQRVAAIRFPVPFGPKSINERRRFLSPIYKLIRYHRLIFDSVADGVFRSTYLPWIDSIAHVKAGEKEEIELRLNSSYENVWRVLKERLDEPAVRLKSQYSSRLYLWAKQYIVVGHKRVSIATLRKILGLEDVKDNSGRVVQDAPLELWANLKQRALDVALKEINKHSDIKLELEFVGRGAFRKVLSLGFRITARKPRPNRGQARSSAIA